MIKTDAASSKVNGSLKDYALPEPTPAPTPEPTAEPAVTKPAQLPSCSFKADSQGKWS
jgi:hypothetical protein